MTGFMAVDLVILLVFEIKLRPTLASIFLTSVLVAIISVVIPMAVTHTTAVLAMVAFVLHHVRPPLRPPSVKAFAFCRGVRLFRID